MSKQLLTVSGNEITDQARTAALLWSILQQGGSTDGAAPPAGVGVWEAATNLFRRGQCDAIGAGGAADSAWSQGGGGVVTRTVDATTPAPFSPNSIKHVCDGTAGFQGPQGRSATGQAAPAGTIGVGSVWFKGVAGQTYIGQMLWLNTDATTTLGVSTAPFAATGGWQLVTPAALAVAVGKIGDRLQVSVQINGTRAETNWAAHAMLQTGVNVCSPYVATSQAATATRNGGRVQAPAALLNRSQCWAAFRIAYGFPSTAVRVNPCYLLDWRDDANNLLGLWLDTANKWNAGRLQAGAGATAQSAAQVFSIDTAATIIFACDSGTVKVSVNGGAFTSVANTSIPTLAAALADLASQAAASQLDGRVLWATTGTGTLTDAQAAQIAGWTNPDAALDRLNQSLPGAAATALWPTLDSSILVTDHAGGSGSPFPGLVTAAVTVPGGQRYEFTPIQTTLKWGTVVNGGFADCSFNVSGDQRDKFVPLSIVRLYVGAETVWEGQLEDPELTISDGSWQTALAAFGLQRKLSEQSVRRIWVKRDLNWQDVLSGTTADGLATTNGAQVTTGSIDPTDATRIGMRIAGSGQSFSNLSIAGSYFLLPALATELLFDLTVTGFASAFHFLVDASPDGTNWTTIKDVTLTTGAAAGGSFSVAVPAGTTQIRAYLKNETGVGVAALSAGLYLDMVNIRLLGTAIVEDAAGGLYGGTILADVAAQCVGISPGRIEAGSDFLIQQCTRDTRDTLASVVQEVASYYTREWYVWEDATFSWVTVNLDQPDWIINAADSTSLNLKSTVEPVGLTVIVTFTDVAGNPGEGRATATSQRNPYVKQGVPKDIVVSASVPMTTNTAAQLASIIAGDDEQWLPVQGEVVVPAAAILARRGNATPAYAIRAGDNLLIADLPKSDLFAQGRDGETLFHITAAVSDLEAGTVTLTLESQINVADVLIARLGAITNILTGSPNG